MAVKKFEFVISTRIQFDFKGITDSRFYDQFMVPVRFLK